MQTSCESVCPGLDVTADRVGMWQGSWWGKGSKIQTLKASLLLSSGRKVSFAAGVSWHVGNTACAPDTGFMFRAYSCAEISIFHLAFMSA